jgi:hypothetical protein
MLATMKAIQGNYVHDVVFGEVGASALQDAT